MALLGGEELGHLPKVTQCGFSLSLPGFKEQNQSLDHHVFPSSR